MPVTKLSYEDDMIYEYIFIGGFVMPRFHQILAICLSISLLYPTVASADTNTASWLKWKTTKLSAHRGAHLTAPENSIASIIAAKSLGYKFIEIDIRQTKDKKYILMHDEEIDRTTSGNGTIAQKTYAQISKYHLVTNQNKLTTEKIPTLDEALTTAKKMNLGVNIDGSKGDWTNEKYVSGIVSRVKAKNMYAKTLFIIPNKKARTKFHKKYPNATISFVGNPKKTLTSDLKELKKYKYKIYTSHITKIDAASAKKIRKSGIRIHIYGVNTQKDYKRAKSYKPLLIETDKIKP